MCLSFFSPSVLILTLKLAACSKDCHCYCNVEFLCYGVGTEVVSVIVRPLKRCEFDLKPTTLILMFLRYICGFRL